MELFNKSAIWDSAKWTQQYGIRQSGTNSIFCTYVSQEKKIITVRAPDCNPRFLVGFVLLDLSSYVYVL